MRTGTLISAKPVPPDEFEHETIHARHACAAMDGMFSNAFTTNWLNYQFICRLSQNCGLPPRAWESFIAMYGLIPRLPLHISLIVLGKTPMGWARAVWVQLQRLNSFFFEFFALFDDGA
jgi:hypothetical protein